jgi:predicted CxxxxCH...CXXCH cytochrome family protein
MRTQDTIKIIIVIIILLILNAIPGYALDYPHYDLNNISCDSCHFVYGSEPSLLPEWTAHTPQDIDDTQYNTLCWSCHNDIEAPYVRTHSSLNTSDKYGDADGDGEAGWSMECRVCHDPHQQRQFRAYGSESYVYEGVVSSVTATTLTESGASWSSNEYKGMIIYPNVEEANYNYRIVGNTSDTITVAGPIDLTRVSVGDTFAITYGKLIKSTIGTPNSGNKTVKFFKKTGANSYADGDTTYNGICEVCHTQTIYHRNDVTADHSHNVGVRCTTCHQHIEGFKGVGCDVCHGYPPVVDSATGGPDGLVNNPGVTGSSTAGAHDMHVNTKLYPCEVCHYNSVGSGPTHNDGPPQVITIGFSLFGGAYVGGIYDGQTTASYDSSEVNTTVLNTGSMTCDNIYCHGKLPDGTIWGGGKETSPAWDGSVTCSSCHDTGGALSDLSGKHAKHTDGSTYGFACEKCHYETASGSNTIKNQSYHANNVKDIVFAAGGVFDSGTKSCTSTYCHSDARGGAPNVAVKWSDTFSMQCDSCHNGRTGLDTLEMVSNGHDRLVSSDWVRHYPCYYCHDATVDTSSNIKDYSKHVNENIDVVMASKWYIAGNPAPSYDPNTKVCDNVYCHSDGTTVDPEVRPFAWTEGHAKCNTCHGHPTGSCSDCHTDITGWPPGEEWKSAMPMYENTGPGTERANTHERHLLTDFSCDNCHFLTIANGTCTDCHSGGTPSGSMDEVNHINPTYHVNKIKDVVFKAGGTYDQINKTCSNTACHTGTDPQWGDSVNNTVICLTCHGTTEADVDDFAKFNDIRAKINMNEWEDTGHGRPADAGNYPSGNPPADFPGNPCWYCHDNEVLHNDSTNPFRLKKHQQFERRFEKECVYCHMEGLDSECMGCHNDAESLAPQLVDITNPPFSQDHTTYTDGQTSCVDVCHATDEQRHNTGAGLWTAEEKADVQNQYVMMGVCLVCHDDDSNGRCEQCHTGPQYQLGYDPGTGFIVATSKATSTHFGYKHYAAYENEGVWKGGKFCWDCHDPHGDSNIYMIQDKIATETDGTFGIPISRRDVTFTRKQTGLDYARISEPFDGICNVCHTETGQHYRYDYGDGHNAGRICTECHEHRFSDSHASGQACNTCHLNKPIARHSGFGLPRDCTKCHNGVIYGRMDIMGQFRSNSHHIQGVTVTNRHCYACHWEATDIGLIDVNYHAGYNYKTHTSVKDAEVDLVIWGPGERPTNYESGVTAVTFDKSKIGTAEERTEVAKVTEHCLGCHSDQNNDTEPFNIVDPDNGDCKTPRQYAWDRTSIAARYLQTGTTTWGKYTGVANAAKKDIVKAYSAHGNAVANEGGWDASTGLDETIPNTRNGTENVQCYDCHNSHGSKAEGITSSYRTFNGTYNGANLKETQAGKGGYQMTYKASANTDPDAVNPYNAGAALCFDCHETETAGATPWGYNSTFGATEPIMGYKDTSHFGPGTKGSTARFPYRASREILGGHLKASSELKGLDGVPNTGDEAVGAINGLCTPCHDPHGVSPTLGDDQQYAVPLLKGTWLTSPYKEDLPQIQVGSRSYRNPGLYWWTDRRTFGGGRISESEEQFAGLCLRCHPKENLTDGIQKNSEWKSLDRVHESVKGWGSNAEHSWPCSKCHQPHNSGLPRLLQTNCLDYNHIGRVESGGMYKSGRGRYPRAKNSLWHCHESSSAYGGEWYEQYWNNVSPW